MGWHARLKPRGVIALARCVSLSISCFQSSVLLLAGGTTESITDAPPVLHLVLPLLEQLQRDQAALRQAIEQLDTRQETVLALQRKGMRDQLNLTRALFAQREQDLESLRARSRRTLTTVGLVAGPFLLGLGCLAFSLFRTLQRFSARLTRLAYGSMFYWSDAAVLGAPEGRVSMLIQQMEQRLLKLENVADATAVGEGDKPPKVMIRADRSALPSRTPSSPAIGPAPGGGEPAAGLPGDFV